MKRKIAALPKEIKAEARKSLEKSAQQLNKLQKQYAPRDSGDLIASIGYTFGEYKPANSNVRGVSGGGGKLSDPDLTVVVHAGDEKAYYAKWIEFGLSGKWEIKGLYEGSIHPGFGPRPYFFAPFRANKKLIKNRLRAAAKRGAKKAVT